MYVLTQGSRPRAIPCFRLSDGSVTVIDPLDGAELAAGSEVVTAVLSDQASTTNPFGPPQMGAPRGVR